MIISSSDHIPFFLVNELLQSVTLEKLYVYLLCNTLNGCIVGCPEIIYKTFKYGIFCLNHIIHDYVILSNHI